MKKQLLLCFALSLVLGQAATKEFSKATVEPFAGGFEVAVSGGGSNLVVGVRPTTSASSAIALRAGAAGGAPVVSALPTRISPGKLEVLVPPIAATESVVIAVALPEGIQVTIVQAGQRVSMPVRGSAIVRNGLVQGKSSPVTMAQLLAEALRPEPEMRALSGDEYQLSGKALRDRAVRLVIPTVTAVGATCCDAGEGLVTAMITVNESGRVTSIQRHFGEAALYAACETAIRQWEFRPLSVAGKTVRVRSVVHFRLQKDGTLTLLSN